MPTLSLAKLHGAGNDFLFLASRRSEVELTPELVRALCDRHRGIGADGLLRAAEPRAGGDLRMELWNADGSRAETSGNGIRCLVLGAIDAGLVSGPRLRVETDAGIRSVSIEGGEHGGAGPVVAPAGGVAIEVEMGTVSLGAESVVDGLPARRASVGNPHLVLVAPSLEGVDIEALGRRIEATEPGGLNVEVIAPTAGGDLEMSVWERGVGVTLACGTGTCAAAAVARSRGLTGDFVAVRNPGGVLTVRLEGDDPLAPLALLGGPTRRVATVAVDTEELVEVARRDRERVTA